MVPFFSFAKSLWNGMQRPRETAGRLASLDTDTFMGLSRRDLVGGLWRA